MAVVAEIILDQQEQQVYQEVLEEEAVVEHLDLLLEVLVHLDKVMLVVMDQLIQAQLMQEVVVVLLLLERMQLLLPLEMVVMVLLVQLLVLL